MPCSKFFKNNFVIKQKDNLVGIQRAPLAKLPMSNPLDFNGEKINGNNQHFFPDYIQNFSGYSFCLQTKKSLQKKLLDENKPHTSIYSWDVPYCKTLKATTLTLTSM
jgi:hypothetical protein